MPRKHAHYFRNVAHLNEVDVYRVLELFGVTDQALGHAIKKLLAPGGRGAGKDFRKDVQEAIDTLTRRLEMLDEDAIQDFEAERPEPPEDPTEVHPWPESEQPKPYCKCRVTCKGEAEGLQCRNLPSVPIEGGERLSFDADWIPWDGSEPDPVGPSVVVQCQRRGMAPGTGYASNFNWSHRGFGGDILAYRVVST